jgi:SAM-dependent methyltransferase
LLLDEEGPDGHRYAVAYVVPHAERMKAAKSQIHLAGREKRIAQWRSTFNQIYRPGQSDRAPTFIGWNSSFTNKPLPESEMREWLDRTIERIAALAPERVLEIGCGVGLVLQRLAPRCRAYRGTDFSPVAVGRLRDFAATKPDLRHVELLEREATNFDGLTANSVDLVVLNSIVQYFPDLEYLRTVLQRAAGVVASGGHIFVGDVRHLDLLQLFHSSIQLAKAPPEANIGWLKRKISLAIEQERELVIDPRFFLALSEFVPRITGAEVLLKRGPTNNELTRYRYDVILHIDEPNFIDSRETVDWQANGHAVADLVKRFEALRLPAVRILNVPNGRLARDLAAMRLLASADNQLSIGKLRQQAEECEHTGLDPDAFWQLSDSPAYDVRVCCSPHALDGRFDASLVDRERWSGAPPLRRTAADATDQPLAALATDPLGAAFMQQLGLDLGKMLRTRVPDSLLPAAVLAVNNIPVQESRGIARP